MSRTNGRRCWRRVMIALAVAVLIAGITASSAWALNKIFYVGSENQAWLVNPNTDRIDAGWNNNNSSDVMALTGEFSNTICSGCLVRAYLIKTDGTKPCDGTAYGYVFCSLAPNVTVYSRAHCVNPTGSSRWFKCWKWSG